MQRIRPLPKRSAVSIDSVSRERVSAPTVTRSWITLTPQRQPREGGGRFVRAVDHAVDVHPQEALRLEESEKTPPGTASAGALMAKVSRSVAPPRWERICSAMPRGESGLMGPWHRGQNACATRGMSSFR